MPNAKVLESKKAVVETLSAKIKEASSVVFVDYKGITVAQDCELRKQFRDAGVEYTVVKNTLTRFAAKDCGYDFDEVLNGTTAMASTTEDPIAPAKILAKYAKDHENFVLKAGFVDGELLDQNGVKELADTPSKEVLIGRLMGSLQSGLYGFAYAIQAIIDKNEGGESAPVAEAAAE